MKNKHTILLKTVDISPQQRKELSDDEIRILMQEPSKQVVLDIILDFCQNTGNGYHAHNVRWVDTEGETTIEETFYGIIACNYDSWKNLCEWYENEITHHQKELNDISRWRIYKTLYHKYYIKDLTSKKKNIENLCSFKETYNSLKREWFLDIYY